MMIDSSQTPLLTIDVEAEIRKLCDRQLAGSAERLVELVRLMVRCGARSVRVKLSLRSATVETVGGELPEALLLQLAMVADPERQSAERHQALGRCETAGITALMALLAAPAARVESGGAHGFVLSLRAGKSPRLQRKSGGGGLTVRLVQRRGRDDARILARACRFASLPIFLGGRLLSRGLHSEDCLLEASLKNAEVECKVGLPRSGELCQTIVLCHDIVAKELYGLSPRGHAHIAVIRDLGAERPEGVDIEAALARVRDLREQLYQHLVRLYPSLPPADRLAARELLFRRVERSGDVGILSGVAMFRRLAGPPLDLPAVRAAIRDQTLWGVDAGSLRRAGRTPEGDVLVVDRRERDFLTRMLEVAILQPPSQVRDSGWLKLRALLRRAHRHAGDALRGIGAYLAGTRPLSDAALSPAEQRFVAALGAELSAGRYILPNLPPRLSSTVVVGMTERGRLPVQVGAYGDRLRLLLPRRHPRVAEMVRRFESDAWSLYPSMAVLLGGYDGFGLRKLELQSALLAG